MCSGPSQDNYVAGGKGEKDKDVTKGFQQEPGPKGQGQGYPGQQQQRANGALLLMLAKAEYVARGSTVTWQLANLLG